MEEKTTLKRPGQLIFYMPQYSQQEKIIRNHLVVRTAIRSLMTHDPTSISKNWASNSDTASHRTNPQLVCFFQQGPSKLCNRVEDVWRLTLLRVLSKRILWRSFLQILLGSFGSCKFLRCSFLVWTTICYDVQNHKMPPLNQPGDYTVYFPYTKPSKNSLLAEQSQKPQGKNTHVFSQIFRLEKSGTTFQREPRLEFEECGGCKDAGS